MKQHEKGRLSYVETLCRRRRALIPPSTSTARPVITILLSTFNGERFLDAQLDSFMTQTYQDWVLYWRDDGSSDGTIAIMRGFASRLPPGRCIQSPGSGPHLGASASFLSLLAEAHHADAVAFADQDDVWLPTKLEDAARHVVEAGHRPMLYCARQYLVDEALRGSRLSAEHGDPPGFPASLTQNIANGNTLVMNKTAAGLVVAMGQPEHTVHDWWSYIVVSACGGRIIFDGQPQVLYRLHKKNLIGTGRPLPARALAAVRRGPAIFMTMMRRHADALALHANRLTPQAREDLRLVQSALQGGISRRIAALSCRRFRRATWLENLLFGFWFMTDHPGRALPGELAIPHWALAEDEAVEALEIPAAE